MEISKCVKLSKDERNEMSKLADLLRTILDEMNAYNGIDTEYDFWDYDQIAKVVDILRGFAENDILAIR